MPCRLAFLAALIVSAWLERPAAGRRRRAAGQIARGISQVDPGRARFHGRAGRHRAPGQRPDRLRVGGRRQALGRRDGRLPAGCRRQRQTRRRRPVPGRHRRRRPIRQADDLSRRPGLPDRRHALAQGRPGRVRSGYLLCRGSRRRRQGRPSRGALHRLWPGEPAAPVERLRAGPGRLGLWRQRRQRRQGPLR